MCNPHETHEPPQAADTAARAASAADEATAQAGAEWDKARRFCDHLHDEATQRLKRVRETTMGDLLDAAMAAVRRRPGIGVTVALAAGFLLGRMFRR